jgi:L-threonylcarbamoyladenylate synthase
MNDTILQAAKILQQGGIVVFPTDTAYGIGCRIDNEDAVKRLFALRKRPESQATPVLVSSPEMAKEYFVSMPEEVEEKLVKRFWPGALTIVLHCQTKKIPRLVRGGGDTLGIRLPNHEIPLGLIAQLGVPLLAPSANFHGEQTPFTFADLNPELIKSVDYVLEGECKNRQASTVINCSVNPWKILRQGAVTVSF